MATTSFNNSPFKRHPAPSTGRGYDQTTVIAAVTDLYAFLTQLPHLDPSELVHPPPAGWPNINQTAFQRLHKTDAVINLLAHLPYITSSPHYIAYPAEDEMGLTTLIAPQTHIIDYHGLSFGTRVALGTLEMRKPPQLVPADVDFPDWVVPLTAGDQDGDWLMLDTSDGTISLYSPARSAVKRGKLGFRLPDPRRWRNQCVDPKSPWPSARECFAEYTREIVEMRRLPFFALGQRGMLDAGGVDGGTAETLRAIYRRHGFPDLEKFRREECRAELLGVAGMEDARGRGGRSTEEDDDDEAAVVEGPSSHVSTDSGMQSYERVSPFGEMDPPDPNVEWADRVLEDDED